MSFDHTDPKGKYWGKKELIEKEWKAVKLNVPPAIVTKDGREIRIIWSKGETVDHWMMKTVAVMRLLLAGFQIDEIFIEKVPDNYPTTYRADVYTRKKYLKNPDDEVWVECRYLDGDKLREIRDFFNGRIIHLMDHKTLEDIWHGKRKYHDLDSDDSTVDIMKNRNELLPLGTEIWGVYLGQRPKVVHGVRRENKEFFTYLEGEWTIKRLRPRKNDKILSYSEW